MPPGPTPFRHRGCPFLLLAAGMICTPTTGPRRHTPDDERLHCTAHAGDTSFVLAQRLSRRSDLRSAGRSTTSRQRPVRTSYARALYEDDRATLDDLHEAVTMLEDTTRITRRVFGGAHPLTAGMEWDLHEARAALRAREALLAKYLLYGASALAIASFALVQLSRRR